jgi:outer membrane protein assembly factor BamB
LILLLLARPLCAGADVSYPATNLWKAYIGWDSRSSPAVGRDGAIYIGTWQGQLLAFNPDGSRRWMFKTGSETVSSPAIGAAETIYIGCRNRKLFAVDARGKCKWSFKTGGWVDASAAIAADGTIYVGSWDGQFYALNPDGSKKWSFKTGGPIVSSAAIGADGVIYFGSHDRKFYALNTDGSKRWDCATGGAILSSPAISPALARKSGAVYFTSTDGKLHALNGNGTRRWELHTGGIAGSSPVLGVDGTIYVSVNTNHCAVRPDGKFKWIRRFWNPPPGESGETAAAVLADGLIVFTGGDGFVMTVPPEDADKGWIWLYGQTGPIHSSVAVSPQGTIYVAGSGQYLHAIVNAVPLANSAWPMFRADAQHTGRVRTGR